MALSAVRALLVARSRSLLNRMRRDTGRAGGASAALLAGVVALVLFLPALTLGRLGVEFGVSWASAGGGALAWRWAALQTVFTLLFPLLGATRYRPLFAPAQVGALPVSAGELFAAELPSALFEVFPLLGALGVIASNVGLASEAPRFAPLALLLALQGAVWIVALTVALGCLWRATPRWAGLGAALACCTALLVAMGSSGGRAALRSLASEAVRYSPGTWLCAGFERFEAGESAGAALRAAAAFGATATLVVVAAWLRRRLLDLQPARRQTRWRAVALAGWRRPAGTICGLTLVQLFDARGGRLLFLLPALITLPAAVAGVAIRLDRNQLRLLPDQLALALARVDSAPWYALVAVVAVAVDSAIWLNPFGWFRSGIRTLLVLPVVGRDLLRGMLGGFAIFATAQTALAVLPLLALRSPRPDELLVGSGAAAFALFLLGGAGQAIGLQFPRAVSREGSAEIPFHLSWIPLLLAGTTAAALVLGYRLAELHSARGSAVLLPLMAVLAGLSYRTVLPLLEAEVWKQRERLISL